MVFYPGKWIQRETPKITSADSAIYQNCGIFFGENNGNAKPWAHSKKVKKPQKENEKKRFFATKTLRYKEKKIRKTYNQYSGGNINFGMKFIFSYPSDYQH